MKAPTSRRTFFKSALTVYKSSFVHCPSGIVTTFYALPLLVALISTTHCKYAEERPDKGSGAYFLLRSHRFHRLRSLCCFNTRHEMHSLASPMMEVNSGAYNHFKSLESQSHCCYVVQKTICRRCPRRVSSSYDGPPLLVVQKLSADPFEACQCRRQIRFDHRTPRILYDVRLRTCGHPAVGTASQRSWTILRTGLA